MVIISREAIKSAQIKLNNFKNFIGYRTRLLKKIFFNGKCPPIKNDFSLALPFNFSFDFGHQLNKIGVVCHIFNIEIADEMLGYLLNITFQCDLYVSTDTKEKCFIIKEKFKKWKMGSVLVRVSENRGRDISHKYITFSDVFDKYRILLFLHSKKTQALDGAEEWRKNLFYTLCGSEDIVNNILFIFEQFKDIGIIFPQHYTKIRKYVTWNDSYFISKKLAARMGIKIWPRRTLDFPAGSMFWARSDALHPILRLNLAMIDFPPELGQTEGTIAHALERLPLFACEKAGYKWIKVSTRNFCDLNETAIAVDKLDDLNMYLKNYLYNLMY